MGTLSIGKSGAKNAGLMAAAILGGKYPEIRERLRVYRENLTASVMASELPV